MWYFETSKGQVTGRIENDQFIPDPDGLRIIKSLFDIDTDLEWRVENGWVFISLDDPFYGAPEYKLVQLS